MIENDGGGKKVKVGRVGGRRADGGGGRSGDLSFIPVTSVDKRRLLIWR